jgi:hypothetical protein
MSILKRARAKKVISAKEFDEKFRRGEDIGVYLDRKNAVVVKRVNVDFPSWMIQLLDKEALKLNVSRQAVIKMWIHDRLMHSRKAA